VPPDPRQQGPTTLLKTANTVSRTSRPSSSTAKKYVKLADTKPSFDASLLYRINPNATVYARVARGFRGPTIQGRSAVFNSPFTTADSETNTSWEAGLKTAFLDNKVHFNLTGFHYTVDNMQLNGNDSNGNGVLFNAKKGTGYGMEAELEARPTQNFRVNVGLSLLHTEIQDKGVYAQVGAANNVMSQTVLNPTVHVGTNYFAQIDGNAFPNAPTYNLNIGARYDLPLSDDSKLFIAGDFNMQGKTNYVLYKTVEYTSNGNNELGAKIGYAFGKYEIAAFARNLTNNTNLVDVIDTSNYRAGIYNDPRVFGVMFSGSFR
jgi:iron complex outermembrane receptor protein